MLRHLAEACGFVDRIADHRVFEAGLCTDVTGDGPAGRHPDAELRGADHREELVVQRTRGRQCRAGRVWVLDRCAENLDGRPVPISETAELADRFHQPIARAVEYLT